MELRISCTNTSIWLLRENIISARITTVILLTCVENRAHIYTCRENLSTIPATSHITMDLFNDIKWKKWIDNYSRYVIWTHSLSQHRCTCGWSWFLITNMVSIDVQSILWQILHNALFDIELSSFTNRHKRCKQSLDYLKRSHEIYCRNFARPNGKL